MKLYVDSLYTSPYAMSVFVALTEKNLEFSIETVDLEHGANHTTSYAATSTTQRVPTLEHEGFTLSESSAITEYLEELHPLPPLYPQDVKARARARQIQAWLRSDLLALRIERSTEVVFYHPVEIPLTEAAQAAADKLLYAAGQWLTPGAEHLFDNWCIADTDLALMLNRLVLNGDPVPEHLATYARRQWQRASVQAWVGQPRARIAD